MSYDYSGIKGTAEKLISRFGKTVSVRRSTAPTGGSNWDPGAPTTKDYSAKGVVLDYSSHERDGTFIKATDKKLLLSTEGLTITPGLDDAIVAGGLVYQIVPPLKPLEPGDTTILWEIQIRR